MKRTKEEATETRQAILTAALKVFSQKGYGSTHLEEIAKAAGVTRGAIYWHFKNKLDVFRQLLAHCELIARQRAEEVLRADYDPLTKIRRLVTVLAATMEEEEEFRAVEQIVVFRAERSEELKPFLEERAQNIQQFREELEKLIEAAVAAGQILPQVSVSALATALVGYIIGLEVIWFHDQAAFSPKENTAHFLDILLKAVTPA